MWISPKQGSKGFTLIELLVVIAIIGILATVASVSLTQARRRARDTKRVADIQQIRNGLVIYSNQRATYPTVGEDATTRTLGADGARCLDDSNAGFVTSCDAVSLLIMQRVPGEQVVGHPPYVYTKTGLNSYTITFRLDGEIGDLSRGDCVATQDEISCVPMP